MNRTKGQPNIVRPGANPVAMRADLERRRSSAASPQVRGQRRARSRKAAKAASMTGW